MLESKNICKYHACNKKAKFIKRFIRPEHAIVEFKLCSTHLPIQLMILI